MRWWQQDFIYSVIIYYVINHSGQMSDLQWIFPNHLATDCIPSVLLSVRQYYNIILKLQYSLNIFCSELKYNEYIFILFLS